MDYFYARNPLEKLVKVFQKHHEQSNILRIFADRVRTICCVHCAVLDNTSVESVTLEHIDRNSVNRSLELELGQNLTNLFWQCRKIKKRGL